MTLAARPANAADAVRRYAQLEAFKDLVKEEQDELRAYIDECAGESQRQTGTPARFKVQGIGQAYVTEPSAKVIVTDDRAWGEWVADSYPQRVATRQSVNVARLLMLCHEDPALAERLRGAHVLEDIAEVDSALLDEIASGLVSRVQRTQGGGFVDRDSGEMLPITTQLSSRASLTIRIDKAARERFIAELRDAGVPSLPEVRA